MCKRSGGQFSTLKMKMCSGFASTLEGNHILFLDDTQAYMKIKEPLLWMSTAEAVEGQASMDVEGQASMAMMLSTILEEKDYMELLSYTCNSIYNVLLSCMKTSIVVYVKHMPSNFGWRTKC